VGADVVYHLLVLLAAIDVELEALLAELRERR
jgi:phosphoribosyl-ATP pyrophosphohydrolase